MAGTNPIVKQSGGKKPSYYAISKQGRRSFRNITYQVGRALSANSPEMEQRYLALKDRGKMPSQAFIALGNRMIRLAFSRIKHQILYRAYYPDYVLLDQINKKLHAVNAKQFYENLSCPTFPD